MKNKTIVYNLIYKMIDANDPWNTEVRVCTFSTETAAERALAADYEDMLEKLDDTTVLDCIRKENYGNNACIKLGFYHSDYKDPGIPEVEVEHTWRVAKTTVDLYA